LRKALNAPSRSSIDAGFGTIDRPSSRQPYDNAREMMPRVRKLSGDEILRLRSRGSRVDLTAYEASLHDLQPGDWGLIQLETDDRVPTIKRRYSLAAHNQRKQLLYRRLRNGAIPFEVQALEGGSSPNAR
jgi:hypothetical protein